MTLEERIADDLVHGDLGTAKRRLASRLRNTGYDGDLLARLGRLCWDMHDPVEAGRFWLFADVEGPEVDEAVEQFVRRYGNDHRSLASQLPSVVRRADKTVFSGDIRGRLERLGLADVVSLAHVVPPTVSGPAGFRYTLFTIGCFVVTVFGVLMFVVGISTTFEYLFKK